MWRYIKVSWWEVKEKKLAIIFFIEQILREYKSCFFFLFPRLQNTCSRFVNVKR